MKCVNKFFKHKFKIGGNILNSSKLLQLNKDYGKVLFIYNYTIKRFSENKNNSSNNYSENESDQNKIIYPEVIKTLFENNIKIKKLPCFEVYSSQIEILHLPMDFYLATLVIK